MVPLSQSASPMCIGVCQQGLYRYDISVSPDWFTRYHMFYHMGQHLLSNTRSRGITKALGLRPGPLPFVFIQAHEH